MSTLSSERVVRRHSLLKRNPALTREQFSRHYEHHHGPHAAGLAGFRKFTSPRYVQNHVEDLPDASEPPLDGVTMTTQVPREDYHRGFFNEPDYAEAKPDELYLFDIERSVSVLGWEEPAVDAPTSGDKALILTQAATLDIELLPGLVRRFDALRRLPHAHTARARGADLRAGETLARRVNTTLTP